MKLRSKKAFAVAGATLTVAAGAGGALAAGQHGRGPAGHPGPVAIASYLGLTPAQLREQLRAGKTLAQIAVAQGKTVAGLEDAIYKDVQAHLDQAVANGRLTGAQEQAMLAQLKAHLDDIVNHSGPPRVRRAPAARTSAQRSPRTSASRGPSSVRSCGAGSRSRRSRSRRARRWPA